MLSLNKNSSCVKCSTVCISACEVFGFVYILKTLYCTVLFCLFSVQIIFDTLKYFVTSYICLCLLKNARNSRLRIFVISDAQYVIKRVYNI